MTTTTMTIPRVTESNNEGEIPGKSRRWARLLPLISILGGTAAIGWHASFYGRWIVDDAAITFAYARSVAEGLGPVLQPGADPVEGFSNPTWLALLAVGHLFGLFDTGTIFGIPDYVLFPKALALLCCAGVLAGCYVIARKVTRRPSLTTSVVGLVLAAVPSFVIWCFSGLENSLFALIVVWLAAILFLSVLDDRLLSPKVAMAAGAFAALAALTRPEGLIYMAAYPLVVLIRLRRPALRSSVRSVVLSVGTFALPFGTYLCWRYFEFGRLLSNPAVAKGQDLPQVTDLGRAGEVVQYTGALAVLVVMVTVGVVLASPSRVRSGLLALFVPLLLAIGAYTVMVPDWMAQHRFATPVWPLAALAGTCAATEVVRQHRTRGRVLLTIGLVVALIPSAVTFAGSARQFRENPTVPMCFIANRLGRVFNGYADLAGVQHASLLLPDLGGSAMASQLTLVDMAGLTEPKIADFLRDGDMTGLRNYVFDDVKPTFIHSRGPWSAGNGVPSDPRMNRDYNPIYLYPGSGLPNGDWVRKDAVPDGEKLKSLRAYALSAVLAVEHEQVTGPRRECGPALRPGQTVTG